MSSLQVDEEGGVVVKPTPCFVLKTKEIKSGRKVFMNICCHELVEAPHLKSIISANGNDESAEQQGIRIPISLGERNEETDKSGNPCDSFDVIVNPETIKNSLKNVEFKNDLCLLAIHAISQKYKIDQSQRYVLPKMVYKGSDNQIRSQRIKIKKESQISEVKNTRIENREEEKASEADIEVDTTDIPPFTVEYQYEHGISKSVDGLFLDCYKSVSQTVKENLKKKVFNFEKSREIPGENSKSIKEKLKKSMCVICIPLPNVRSFSALDLQISDECMCLNSNSISGKLENFRIFFPFNFDSTRSVASWDKKRKILKINIPTIDS